MYLADGFGERSRTVPSLVISAFGMVSPQEKNYPLLQEKTHPPWGRILHSCSGSERVV